jgi:hypothetical protein
VPLLGARPEESTNASSFQDRGVLSLDPAVWVLGLQLDSREAGWPHTPGIIWALGPGIIWALGPGIIWALGPGIIWALGPVIVSVVEAHGVVRSLAPGPLVIMKCLPTVPLVSFGDKHRGGKERSLSKRRAQQHERGGADSRLLRVWGKHNFRCAPRASRSLFRCAPRGPSSRGAKFALTAARGDESGGQ